MVQSFKYKMVKYREKIFKSSVKLNLSQRLSFVDLDDGQGDRGFHSP